MKKLVLFFAALALGHSAQAIETFTCHGTEPFWGATLKDGNVSFGLLEDVENYTENVTYSAAQGTTIDAVMVVQAQSGSKSLSGFVTANRFDLVVDSDGYTTDDYQSLCTDSMSDFGYPYTVHMFVDGQAFTGCCYTETNRATELKTKE